MPYREIAPPPELAALVRCLWVRTADADTVVDVMPDGCVDIVVRDSGVETAGPDTHAVASPVARGETLVGVRFQPGAAAAALGVPACELLDARVPLDALWGRAADELGERVAAGGPQALAAALARRRINATPDTLVTVAAGRLARRPDTRIAELARTLAIGERQLRRRFDAAVGYGPKTFARVMRFRRLLALLDDGEPLAGAAAAAGYSDQPHMTRETRELAGRSPASLI